MKKWTLLMGLLLATLSSAAQPNYDFDRLQREQLGRGVIAVRQDASAVIVSWRYLSSDSMDESFDVYRDGQKLNTHPLQNETFFKDNYTGSTAALYTVKAIKGHTESSYQLPENAPLGYLNIPLVRPESGVTPAGDVYTYSPNDASIGDVMEMVNMR
ncbi:rhamnogalacturonan lyase [Bacteroides reticulotermitis JCM 10512]|uniref:Rhamnogalacturonan lyase n=1 Tax=Bacteroides reticulotermitis JCM 10512 TaxID=1445607 RepID=W4UVE8_9BACE|nr:rhamnogalacturonan lyase [Bacteroides reticulotermitis JCM 10512]